jgi:hypothetical protein
MRTLTHMDGYTALLVMRAKRQALEAELAAPHKEAADRSAAIALEERRARQGLERLLASKMLPEIIQRFSRDVARYAQDGIWKAVAHASKASPTTTLEVPTDMLQYADPESVLSRVVDWWRNETLPKMEFRVDADMALAKSDMMVLDIRMPQMGYRQAVPIYS